ncbi:zinc ribbon domain-containing protein [Neobacillus niacini]|uniref:zinc ribbon domain-containing protein n=1 Tax=Neobacillus niacini TaxID=86668 RepID=UPI003001CAF5
MDYVNGIALANGEKVVRKYEASVLKKPKSKGYLIATNRRLIFSGEASGISGKSVLVREVKIDQVSGIESFYGKGWSIGKLVMAIILTIFFLIMFNATKSPFGGMGISWIFLLALAWPAYIVYKMVTNPGNQMALQVIATAQSPSAIGVSVESGTGILGALFSSLGLGGSHAWMSVAAAGPGKHTEVMVRELGALIQDIQVMGDHAIEKWGQVEVKATKINTEPQTNLVKQQLAATVEKIQEKTAASYQTTTSCSCGAIVDADDLFCGSCGKKVKQDNDEEIFG